MNIYDSWKEKKKKRKKERKKGERREGEEVRDKRTRKRKEGLTCRHSRFLLKLVSANRSPPSARDFDCDSSSIADSAPEI